MSEHMELPERESMEFDVVIVGAGPAGLSAAIRLKQVNPELSVVVLEKGAEVGAHILSGAVVDPIGIDRLLPDWRQEEGHPFTTPVTDDQFLFFGPAGSLRLPNAFMPPLMNNHGNYIVSLGLVCRWLAGKAEELGVEIYPGFAATEVLYGEDGRVIGVATGDMGIEKNGEPGPNYTRGMALLGKYVLIGEGVRGSLAKQLIAKFKLDEGREPQKFGIGFKELWEVKPEHHKAGLVQHSFGWPLDMKTGGGSFLYHFGDHYVSIGFVVHLNYQNPYLSPYDEFQRFKLHPLIRDTLEGGQRVAYGARAINEGGYQSVPKLVFPGGALIGCSAGFVNLPRIKGSHTAMKSGMLAAEAAFEALSHERASDELAAYPAALEDSWVAKELKTVRNAEPFIAKFGPFAGTILAGTDMWMRTLGIGLPFTLKHHKDNEGLWRADIAPKIDYPKPDGVISFDRLSSVFLSNTNHEEDQPVHLQLKDPSVPVDINLPLYDEPAQRYCPAGVYEIVGKEEGAPRLQINAQNCVHCKTCDIKDPTQNINWVTPEGGGGPNYPNM